VQSQDPTKLNWRKSKRSYDNTKTYDCVELAPAADGTGDVYMRNSKRPTDPITRFTQSEMTAFIAGVKDGEFDDMIA
jgi:hypothetical protein